MTGRLRQLPERLSGPRSLIVMAVALVATSGGAVALARDTGTDEPSDSAFVDARATNALVASATTMVDQVFSVDPRHPQSQERLVANHLSRSAQGQFRELYAPYLSRKAAGITLRTTATSVGVLWLEGSEAQVLVVADQQAAAPDGRTNAGTATIRLTLAKAAGDWQITAIDPV